MDERTRKCNKCGEVKTFDHFHKDKQKHSGVRPICKTCVAEYMRQRYACRSAEARQAWNDYQRRKYQETRTMPKAKKQEKRELTFVEAQFEEVRQFLAEMAIRVEDLAIEIGSIADGEAVNVAYSYTPNSSVKVTSGGKTAITDKVVRITNTNESSKKLQITMYKCTIESGWTYDFPADNNFDAAMIHIKMKGTLDSTRTAGDQLFEIIDEQAP